MSDRSAAVRVGLVNIPLVLGIDLGLTTGWAVVEPEAGHLIQHGEVREHRTFPPITYTGTLYVVVERPIGGSRGDLARRLSVVGQRVAAQFPAAIWIMANLWKPTAVGRVAHRRAKDLGLKSPHERDAYAIACWWWDRYGAEKER